MAKNMYQHYKLSQSKRKVLPIAAFGGVDYSSQKLQVSPHRAVDLLNFVYKDGTIEKREGFTQLAVAPSTNYISFPLTGTSPYKVETNTKHFNGIWHFLAEDGEYHTVAHIGKLLYEVKELTGKIVEFHLLSKVSNVYGEDLFTHEATYEHLDQKSMAFVGNNRLWFLGGNMFMLIGFKSDGTIIYEPVEESSYTYVPTTTIAITYANSIVKGRSGFDYANNMTMWRKNTCLSGTGKSEEDLRQTKYYEYTLDAAIKTKNSKEDVAALREHGQKIISSISDDTLRAISDIRIKIEELVTTTEEE